MKLRIKSLLMIVLALGIIGFAAGCQAESDSDDYSATADVIDNDADSSDSEIPNDDDLVLYDEDGNPIDESLNEDSSYDENTGLGLEDISGSYNGSLYHNDYYGFSMVIPDHWYDQESGQAMASSQSVEFPITLGYAEDPSDVISYLSNFFNLSMSSPVDGVDDQATIDQMTATFKQVTYDGLIEEGLDDSMTKEYEENNMTFGDGLTGKVATVTTESENGTGYATMYLVVLPSHDIVTVMAIYGNPAAGDSIMTMLNSISVDE